MFQASSVMHCVALIAYENSRRAPLFNCEMEQQSVSPATLRTLVMTTGERPPDQLSKDTYDIVSYKGAGKAQDGLERELEA